MIASSSSKEKKATPLSPSHELLAISRVQSAIAEGGTRRGMKHATRGYREIGAPTRPSSQRWTFVRKAALRKRIRPRCALKCELLALPGLAGGALRYIPDGKL